MSALEACQDLFVKSVDPALKSETVPYKIKKALACKWVILLCDSRQLEKQKTEGFGIKWRVTEEGLRQQYKELVSLLNEILPGKGEKSHEVHGNRGSNQRH